MPDDVIIHDQTQQSPPQASPPSPESFTPPPQPDITPPVSQEPAFAPPPITPPSAGVPAFSRNKRNPLLRFSLLIGGGFLTIGILIFAGIQYFHGRNEKITLTWWGLWEDKSVMSVIINDFERAHPNIIINYSKEDPNQYTQRLLTRIPAGS